MRHLARLLSLAALALAPAALAADGPQVVEVPVPPASKWTEFKAAPGRLLVIGCATGGKWAPFDDGCDVVPASDGKSATFSAPLAGRYKLGVATEKGELVRVVVVVGNPEPGPGPGPGPGPTPPVDTLVADIKAAFTADGGKLADLQSLAALYTLMVGECADMTYATAADLNARYVTARDTMLKNALPGVRRRCGQVLGAAIGADPAAVLTSVSRETIAATFARLAKAVEDAAK